MKIEEILGKLVSFNTVNDLEKEKMFDFIRNFLTDYHFKFKNVGACLVAERGKSKIGFLGHTDTVPASEKWMTDPWELVQKGDKLYGLGVCDMKSGIAAMLFAATQTEKAVTFYFTYDEEIGFAGVRDLIEEEEFPETVIICEPTDERVLNAGKGLFEFRIDFSGVRVHSSVATDDKNAIFRATDFINELRYFSAELRKSQPNNNFSIPFTSMNVGQISGGDSVNSTAEKCWIVADFRTNPNEHQKVREKIKRLSNEQPIKLTILNDIEPFENKILEGQMDRIFDKNFEGDDGMTEASFLPRTTTRIIYGAGPDTSHQADECVSLESLKRVATIYEKLIEQSSQ